MNGKRALRAICIPPAALCLILFSFLGTQPAQARVELQPCHNGVSPQKQIELGQKAAQQVYKQMPILPDSSPVTQYMQALGMKLAAQAPGYKWPFNFHVVNVADINAFALPGGSIFVNLGTIQAADDEAQLAAVMAHEISHVVLQHSVCNLEKEQRVGLIAGLGQLASQVLFGNSVIGGLAQEGIGLTAGLGFLKMSRGDEKQADLEGVGILYDAGYDPRAMAQFFETIEAKYGKGGAQFLSDHPNPGNRTDYVDREVATFPPRPSYTTNTPQFRQIHRVVAKMHAYTSKEVASGVWKRKSPNQTVSTGVNQYSPNTPAHGHIDTSTPQSWTTFNGSGFSMTIPSNWQQQGNQNAAMLAPPGGISQGANGQSGNLVYGMLTDVYKPEQQTDLRSTFNSLLQELTRENPGLQPGSISRITVAGNAADSVQSINPSANSGHGEQDWIVGVPINGGMRYFVFVAPQPDFNTMLPTFQRMLNSIQLQ